MKGVDLAMGRKRNQGKARRAAKAAKAREEAERRGDDNQTANSSGQPLAAQMRQLEIDEQKCKHGCDPFPSQDNLSVQFITAFRNSFREADDGCTRLSVCLAAAKNATLDKFAALWNDAAEMEVAISQFLFVGTHQYLGGQYDNARDIATFVRYFEQHIAVELKQTQALIHWPKITDANHADDHTLVKFFRRRIPCSCLDEKYEEVKSITKMSLCINPKCNSPDGKVERSKAMYCSRCRSIVYCSRECQVADWSDHKPFCDGAAAVIAKFEAKQQNM